MEMVFTGVVTVLYVSCCSGESRFCPFSVNGEPSGLTDSKVRTQKYISLVDVINGRNKRSFKITVFVSCQKWHILAI